MKGLFITFEGIDGCGKTTQIEMLSSDLQKEGIPFVLIREPGGTSIGEKIRTILLDKANSGMDERTELLLYEAARAQIVKEKIIPELESGKVVICDRFYDSMPVSSRILRSFWIWTRRRHTEDVTAGLMKKTGSRQKGFSS